MYPVEQLLIVDYGIRKTCKTSFLLSLPKPLVVFDFDLSFDRASGKFMQDNPDVSILRLGMNEPLTTQILYQNHDLVIKSFKVPIKLPTKPNAGFMDIWDDQVIPQLLLVAEHDRIKSVGIDTGTIFWNIDHQAHLERVQSSSPKNKDRVNLIQVEYARPNTEAQALVNAVKYAGKQFCSIHHVGPKFGPGFEEIESSRTTPKERKFNPSMITGETFSGFSRLDTLVDVVMRNRLERWCGSCEEYFEPNIITNEKHHNHTNTIIQRDVPVAVVELCGYTLNLHDTKIIEPTYEKLLGQINMARLINGNA